MTDKAILSYKRRKPLIKYKNRYSILKNIKNIDHIIPTKDLNFYKVAEMYQNINFLCMDQIGGRLFNQNIEKNL